MFQKDILYSWKINVDILEYTYLNFKHDKFSIYDKNRMLITCIDCKTEISNQAKTCPKCGAPAPSWFDKLSDLKQSVLAYIFIVVVLFIIIWKFFLSSEIETSDVEMKFGIVSDRHIIFNAKNSGPENTYNYYVWAGNTFWERLFSDKYCEGSFVMKRDEERQIRVDCPDLNFNFKKVSFIVD